MSHEYGKEVAQFVGAWMKVAIIWVLSTMLAILMSRAGLRAENLLLVYLVGVLISIVLTGSLTWGILSAFVFALTFNYLFTEPKLTFHMYDANYAISVLIFVVVAVIVSTLMVKLQRQMQIANKKREITSKINTIGNGFLNVSGFDEIKRYSEESLAGLTGKRVTVMLKESEREEFPNALAEWCYNQSLPCGHGECQFPGDSGLYIPIKNREKTYGVIVFDCTDWSLREEENNRIQMERERLKSTLLRSISHDLRTPLTGIGSNAGFLCDNIGIIDQDTVRGMLKDICKDTEWLSTMVENLLNLTRIQEGRLDINKTKEVVDDIIGSAVKLVSKRVGTHRLKTKTPEEILLFSVDGRLFIQVLVNLLDNAFRHSGEGTTVTISAERVGNNIRFQVSDDGVGIPEGKMAQIFDNFFTTAYQDGDRQRGVGLGLTICKAIVEAQGGRISAFNNSAGGATFSVEMPMEDMKGE